MSFSHIDLCYVTLSLPLLRLLQNCYCYFYNRYHYFHTTLLLNTLLQILSLSGVVELTTQLLILENILSLLTVSWTRGYSSRRLPISWIGPRTPMAAYSWASSDSCHIQGRFHKTWRSRQGLHPTGVFG